MLHRASPSMYFGHNCMCMRERGLVIWFDCIWLLLLDCECVLHVYFCFFLLHFFSPPPPFGWFLMKRKCSQACVSAFVAVVFGIRLSQKHFIAFDSLYLLWTLKNVFVFHCRSFWCSSGLCVVRQGMVRRNSVCVCVCAWLEMGSRHSYIQLLLFKSNCIHLFLFF